VFGPNALSDALTAQMTKTARTSGGQTVQGSPVEGLPSGYSYVQVATPGTTTKTGGKPISGNVSYQQGASRYDAPIPYINGQRVVAHQPASRYGSTTYTTYPGTSTSAGGQEWAIRGPDGKLYRRGETIPTTVEYDTGVRTGGIGDEFYNKFKQGILDYYMPQVTDQYGDAKNELTYRLARAGTLRSSAATGEVADLAKQNTLNEAKVRSQADTAAADLKSRVASERAKAESQLYATENPEVAANQATAAIRNITAETPELSPLGQIFNIAAIGGANYLKGAMNQSGINKVRQATGGGSTRIVT
jgi:hypothetical protein